jgi:carboxyl-terminal processing protease
MRYFFLTILIFFSFLTANSQFRFNSELIKLNNVFNVISNMYVDSVNEKKLVEAAIVATLKELDPHSSYIPKEEVERVNEVLDGSFEGIGVQFQIFEDTILVVQTISGTPADKVGMMPGDRIVYINDELMAGKKIQNSDVLKRLRGPRGSEVKVQVARRGLSDFLLFRINRDKIPVYSVDAHYMLNNETGYIKINNFGHKTMDEYRQAFTKLQKAGMKNLILSLEGNGGGLMDKAFELADEFLGRGKLVVYTEGLKQPKKVSTATALGGFEQGKLIILVDEYSASASEIVAGAVQDWDRGLIIGRRTFGKGLVQSQIPLNDGSMIRLTVSRYHTPTGRSIQKPYKDGIEKYQKELEERFKHGEMLYVDSIHFPDSLKYQTLMLGRTVYGGGGIMPDLFIPIDTTRFTPLHRKLVAQGIVNKVVVQYIERNRETLKRKYPDFGKYYRDFNIDEAFINQLKKTAETEKITIHEEQLAKSRSLISLQLKALIARDLWSMNEYFRIMDNENESLKKAISIFEKEGEYDRLLKNVKTKAK